MLINLSTHTCLFNPLICTAILTLFLMYGRADQGVRYDFYSVRAVPQTQLGLRHVGKSMIRIQKFGLKLSMSKCKYLCPL